MPKRQYTYLSSSDTSAQLFDTASAAYQPSNNDLCEVRNFRNKVNLFSSVLFSSYASLDGLSTPYPCYIDEVVFETEPRALKSLLLLSPFPLNMAPQYIEVPSVKLSSGGEIPLVGLG